MTEQIRAVTSASNFFRRRLCIGSAAEEAKYSPEPDSEYSEEGKLLHRYFLTEFEDWPDTLTLPQREVLGLANSYANRFIQNVMAEESLEGVDYESDREVALTLVHEGRTLMPGHADVIFTFPTVRIILDAKFGFLEVDPAPDSDQLAIYAVMAQQKWPVERTHVAMIQPRNFGPRITSAVYGLGSIAAAEASIVRDWKRAEKGGKLTAGARQCHFCRAKAQCPEFRTKFFAVYSPSSQAIEACSDVELVRLHEACQFADKIKKPVHEEMRKRIDAGVLTSHKLGNSGDDREVTDPGAMYRAFAECFAEHPGWSAARYDACRKVSWEKLETYVRELTGFSEKKAKELIEELTAPFVTRTPKAKKILQIK